MFPLKPTSEIKETLKKQEISKEYYKILDFESFPPILGQSITLDKNTVIYPILVSNRSRTVSNRNRP